MRKIMRHTKHSTERKKSGKMGLKANASNMLLEMFVNFRLIFRLPKYFRTSTISLHYLNDCCKNKSNNNENRTAAAAAAVATTKEEREYRTICHRTWDEWWRREERKLIRSVKSII